MKTYKVTSAYFTDNTLIPDASSGTYHSLDAQAAASKAYSSLLKYIKKYHDLWFPSVGENPELIVNLDNLETGKSYSYYIFRETAKQSIAGPRVIMSGVRPRFYRWKNRVIPMKAGDTINDTIARYEVRRAIAKNAKNDLN